MTTYRVGYFVGSLAADSINRKLAAALVRLAPSSMEFSEISIRDLPLYSRDYDDDFPEDATVLKEAITAVDALLFVTPEYNRGLPGALKNAIDWASRRSGTNSLSRKPAAMIGASTGKLGTAIAQQNLRSILSFCSAPQMSATGGVHPVHARTDHRRRRRHERRYGGLPPQVHGRVRTVHIPRVDRPPAAR